jgi:hypothetical protein
MGSCNGLVGGPRVTPPCLRLLELLALAVQLQNMDMMREAGQTLIAEDVRPFLELEDWMLRSSTRVRDVG